MSKQQLVKIQILEKQLQAVNEHPGANNIEKTPAFIHENMLHMPHATFRWEHGEEEEEEEHTHNTNIHTHYQLHI